MNNLYYNRFSSYREQRHGLTILINWFKVEKNDYMNRFTPDLMCDELYHYELTFSDLKVNIKDLEIECFR